MHADEVSNRWHNDMPSSPSQKALAFVLVVVPVIVLAVAIWSEGFSPRPLDILMMLVGFVLSGIGVSVGFHRYFTHRSFDACGPVAFVLGVLGSLAWQGPALEWAQVHRRHHRHSDREDDPHSPHISGNGIAGVIRGAIFAHVGWMFLVNLRSADMARYSPDLRADRTVRIVSKLHYLVAIGGLVVPALVAVAFEPTWRSAWLGLLWGGIFRVFLFNHVTWCVNSLCHMMGKKEYKTGDESRNNAVMGLLAFGEGWHNNHHAFPYSARLGLRWWQVDVGYLVIRVMERLGLVWSVRRPSEATQQARQRMDLSRT